jgi:hypothetical protein
MWNTRADGRYVGSVSHCLVVRLLEIRAYTRVRLGNVCRCHTRVLKSRTKAFIRVPRMFNHTHSNNMINR